MPFLCVREEHSPVSFSEKEAGCHVNILLLLMADGPISVNAFLILPAFFPIPSLLFPPFPLAITLSHSVTTQKLPLQRGALKLSM